MADVLHHGPDVRATLSAATGMGGFLSGLAIAPVGFVIPKGRSAFGMVAANSMSAILFARSHWLVLAIVVRGLMPFFRTPFRATNPSL